MKSIWSEFSTSGKAALLLGAAALAVAVVAAARRDLATRDPSTVRGNPDVWGRVTWMPGAAAAYLIGGRKPETKAG